MKNGPIDFTLTHAERQAQLVAACQANGQGIQRVIAAGRLNLARPKVGRSRIGRQIKAGQGVGNRTAGGAKRRRCRLPARQATRQREPAGPLPSSSIPVLCLPTSLAVLLSQRDLIAILSILDALTTEVKCPRSLFRSQSGVV